MLIRVIIGRAEGGRGSTSRNERERGRGAAESGTSEEATTIHLETSEWIAGQKLPANLPYNSMVEYIFEKTKLKPLKKSLNYRQKVHSKFFV